MSSDKCLQIDKNNKIGQIDVTALFNLGSRMNIYMYMGKSCSLGLLRMSFGNMYQLSLFFFPCWIWMWDLIVFVPDYAFLFTLLIVSIKASISGSSSARAFM